MSTKDAILGHVCVERGWMSEPQLAECLKECDALTRAERTLRNVSVMSRVLLRRRLIPEMELEVLQEEIEKVLRQDGEQEDAALAQALLDGGVVTRAQHDEAVALHKALTVRGLAVRRVEILLEKGYLTLTQLEDSLRSRKQGGTLLSCPACRATATVLGFDPGRIYLCKSCTGELRPGPLPAAAPPPPAPTPTPPPPVSEVGARLGRYSSLTEIGRGGMGVVYKVWDAADRRWVALKVITDRQDIEGLARVRREVDIARSLHHPNIVAVLEVASIDGKQVIVMPYIEGETLACERRSPRAAVQLVVTVARALQYAHSRGVIHRDLKPQNIMIDRVGKPYLMDFGLAKSMISPSSITSVGFAMGTPGFMAPEQAMGRTSRFDRRSDIYSLGAVLYALVTGEPPFRGETPMETIQKVVSEPPKPPSQWTPVVQGALEQVILACLRKERNDRYQSAKQLADELEQILPTLPG